jgi:hypothetical protein
LETTTYIFDEILKKGLFCREIGYLKVRGQRVSG